MRNIKAQNGKVFITETVESIIELKDVHMQLQSIEKEKLRLKEQNRMVVDRFNALLAEEAELRKIVGDLPSDNPVLIGEENV